MAREQYEPGSAKFGNFQNYYSFYPSQARIQHIPFHLLLQKSRDVVCLDVGCNSGELTFALCNTILLHGEDSGICKILAVDIDPLLIERAKEASANHFIKFECVDVLNKEFQCACDSFLIQHSRDNFDIAFLFSITMWIHLNHGDEGLIRLLKYISQKTKLILLEPQPWKCYKTAIRRMKRAKKEIFPYWNEINFKETIEDDLARILREECSFKLVWRSEKTTWGREISLYEKIDCEELT